MPTSIASRRGVCGALNTPLEETLTIEPTSVLRTKVISSCCTGLALGEKTTSIST